MVSLSFKVAVEVKEKKSQVCIHVIAEQSFLKNEIPLSLPSPLVQCYQEVLKVGSIYVHRV